MRKRSNSSCDSEAHKWYTDMKRGKAWSAKRKSSVVQWCSQLVKTVHAIDSMSVTVYIRHMKKVVIADFSKTLTHHTNPTTWSVCVKDGCLGEWYAQERNELYEMYYPFEQAWNRDKTSEWFYEHLLLFSKYGLTESTIKRLISNSEFFSPRAWLSGLYEAIQQKWYELIVVSSGFVEFISEFLGRYDIFPTEIRANYLWVGGTIPTLVQTITPLNKDVFWVDVTKYDKVVLLWDDSPDLLMTQAGKHVTTLWFCDEEKAPGYDAYLGKEWSLEDVIQYL